MKQRNRVTKSKGVRRPGGRAARKPTGAGARRKTGKRKGLSLKASAEERRRPYGSLADALEFYRPIKKPVTLRLDADVIAWFKKDGRRYQTRINSALRKVMDREMEG
jgi:uncharacterized protein (DUF4415 family)